MKQLLLRCWMVTMISGLGCALGSGPADLGGGPDSLEPSGEDAGHKAEGGTLLPDSASEPTTADAAHDATTKDATIVDAKVDAPPSGPCSFAGSLVTFDLSALVGSPLDLPAKATATGVTASPLSRVGVAVTSSSGAMNASNWPTGARDAGKHFVFSVSPPAGCTLTATSLAIDTKASSSGPTKAAVGTSADGFAAVTSFAVTTAGGAVSVPLAGLPPASGNLELHIYGWSASSTTGTLRIEGALSLTGTLAPL